MLPLRKQDLELIQRALDFESQQRYFQSVAEQNSHMKACLRSFAEENGIRRDRIIIPKIELPLPRRAQREAAEQASKADLATERIDMLQHQLQAARDEIDILRDRASYFERMLDFHLQKMNRDISSNALSEESPRQPVPMAGNMDRNNGRKNSPPSSRRHKSSMRRGTYFGSFGGANSPTKRMMARLERERERAKVQQMEQLEDHYNNRLRLMQKRGKLPHHQQPRRLRDVERVDDRLDARLQLELGRKADRDFLRSRRRQGPSLTEIRRSAESKLRLSRATAIDQKYLERSRGNQGRESCAAEGGSATIRWPISSHVNYKIVRGTFVPVDTRID